MLNLDVVFCADYDISAANDLDNYIKIRKLVYSQLTKEEGKTLFDNLYLKYKILGKYDILPNRKELSLEFERIKLKSKRKKKIQSLVKEIKSKDVILKLFVLPVIADSILQKFYNNEIKIQTREFIEGKRLMNLALKGKISFRSLIKNKKFSYNKVIFDIKNRDKMIEVGERNIGDIDVLKGVSIDVWLKKVIRPNNPKVGDVINGFSNEYQEEILLTTGTNKDKTKYVFSVLKLKRMSYLEWLKGEKHKLK